MLRIYLYIVGFFLPIYLHLLMPIEFFDSMTPYSSKIEQQMQRLYSSLNEKDRRRYAAIESMKLGWGGMSYVSNLILMKH